MRTNYVRARSSIACTAFETAHDILAPRRAPKPVVDLSEVQVAGRSSVQTPVVGHKCLYTEDGEKSRSGRIVRDLAFAGSSERSVRPRHSDVDGDAAVVRGTASAR